jgi:hypothetical protein
MGCCGQGRAAYTPAYVAPPRPAPAPPAEASAAATPPADGEAVPGTVRLRFTREAGVRVRGPVSGASYTFSGGAPVQPVDARDADGLLRTGYFRRAY